MTTYTKSTDFLAKDSLPLNNAAKYVKGSEIDTEFDAIETADADNMKKSAMGTGVETFLGTPSSANLAAAVTGETGTGALVFATSPTLVTPALGTPASGTLTNCTGLPAGSITGLGAGIGTFLATPSSANLAAAVTDETGSGKLVFDTSPTLVTPTLGVASATSINKVAITAPASGSTLAIADGKTLTVSNTMTLTGSDGTTYNMDANRPYIYAISGLNFSGNSTTGAISVFPNGTPKKFSISFSNLSSDSTGRIELQLGDAGGIETTGYVNHTITMSGTTTSVTQSDSGTSSILITSDTVASLGAGDVWNGCLTFLPVDTAGYGWNFSGVIYSTGGSLSFHINGYKSLSAAIESIKINVTDGLFDGGYCHVISE